MQSHTRYYFIFFILIPLSASAKFSMDNIVSYVVPKKQEQVTTHERKFDADGTLKISNSQGEIIIKAWNQNQILIETIKKGTDKELEEIAFDTYMTEELISITTKQPPKNNASISYNIIMPRGASVAVKTNCGTTKINNLQGTISVEADNGDIIINDSTHKIYARTNSGDINLKAHKLPIHDSYIILETKSGNIAAHFSPDIHGSLNAKTARGKICSDIEITLHQRTTKLNSEFWKSIKKEVSGIIGKGGPEIKLLTNNGHVNIYEY